MINLSEASLPWNKTDNTPTFALTHTHVTILKILEAIRISQGGMLDEVLGDIVPDLRKRVTFGGFSEERMQSLLEGMWNKVEHALKYPQKQQVKYKSVLIQN